MALFSNFKHKQKKLKDAWQHYGTQNSIWIKFNLHPMVRWKELDKSMYIQCITYNFSTTIKLHVCDSWHITKQKKIEK